MNNWGKIGIVAGVVLILVTLLYFFGFKGKDDTYISDSWNMTYDPNDRGPYGTYMLKELLDTTGMFGNFLQLDEALEETLEDNPDVNDIYFFVGGKNHLSDSSTQYLLDFIYEGNSAVIATEIFPEELLNQLCYDPDWIYTDEKIDSTQYFKFLHSNFQGKRYKFDFIHNNRSTLKTWYYFDLETFVLDHNDTLITLGANTKNEPNFIKIKYGDGELFMISTPYVFTNICMMKRDGFQYAENVLRHVPPGRVQWDKYSLEYRYQSSQDNNESGGGGEERESILQFIMNNPPLLWAFMILLIGAILYAIFKGRRMQKVIPATESKENMSLQYINTLSSLYLQEKKHNKLVRLKEKTFLNFIADHYYIQTSSPDEKFFEKVAIKSHIPKAEIIDIFRLFDELERSSEVSDKALISLHQKIENFYKTCR